MHSFASFLSSEIDSINGAISRALNGLPPHLRGIAAHTALAGGKRIRPAMTLASARLTGAQGPSLYGLAAIPELIHMATLLHDDVLDNAQTRRGRAAAHIVYGTAPSILAGDALLALANYKAAEYGKADILGCVSEAVMMTAEGEVHEMRRQHTMVYGKREYVEIIAGKTGWLLRGACRLGGLYADADAQSIDALSEYGLNLGIAFQIVDDALDFADEAVTGKPTAGDLIEGKFTPPMMMYIDFLTRHAGEEFEKKFKDGSFTDEERRQVAADIRRLGFDQDTRALADEYLSKAGAALERLPDRPERSMLFDALEYVRSRKS